MTKSLERSDGVIELNRLKQNPGFSPKAETWVLFERFFR